MTFAAVLLLAVGAPIALAGKHASSSYQFRSAIPLGMERIVASNGHRSLVLMVVAEAPDFASWSLPAEQQPHAFPQRAGQPVRYFPASIRFRVTATLRTSELTVMEPSDFELPNDLPAFLSQLHFRLRVFDGLNVTALEPTDVSVLGVPLDTPYDERIWTATFSLPAATPIMDRLVLDVLTPAGDRLSRFHLEF